MAVYSWKANQLLQNTEHTWRQAGHDPAVPTNNATERVIGLTYKIRAKTMRGSKSWARSWLIRTWPGLCEGPMVPATFARSSKPRI